MAVTQVYALRYTKGQQSGDSVEIDVNFRVVTDNDLDGPMEVLDAFPVGQPIHYYDHDAKADPDETGNGISPWYAWPEPATACGGSTHAEKTGNYLYLLTTATITGRDKGGTDLRTWVVSARYTYDNRVGAMSVPTVRPYYMFYEQNQQFAGFLGAYNREGLDSETTNTQPGEWRHKAMENGSGVFSDSQPTEEAGVWSPTAILPVSNSAGGGYDEPLTQRISRPAFKLSWFSYTELDFSEAIGRVNSKPYTLEAFDHWDNTNDKRKYSRGYHVFHRRFCPRQLLVNDVQVAFERWGNRTNYRYTVELVYDEDLHDAYLLDAGFSTLARVDDPSSSGEPYEPEDQSEGADQTKRVVGNDGVPVKKEVLFDGKGQKLVEFNSDGTIEAGPEEAIYHRWRHIEEVDFPTTIRDPFDQYHKFDKDSKCPLFMDGGNRYFIDGESPWGLETKCPGDAPDLPQTEY